MIFAGNSNITSFRQQGLTTASDEPASVHWVGALQISHFLDGHPAGAKVRSLFAAEQGWKFLSIGTHDVFALCGLTAQGKQEEGLASLRELYRRVFAELNAQERFAVLVFPQPLHQAGFPGLDPRDIFAIAKLFYDTVGNLCKELNIPVVDSRDELLDGNGEPLPWFVQRDGIHLNVEGVKIYLEKISALTGASLRLTSRETPFEPATETESFCSLLLDEVGIPFTAGPSRDDFKNQLALFIVNLLRDRGLEMEINDETDLVTSGLLDSLGLVQTYTYATEILKLEIPFDVDLRVLNTLSRIADFLFTKRSESTGFADECVSQEDFFLSLRGDSTDPRQAGPVLEADRRIAVMNNALFRKFQKEIAIASHGAVIRYGVVLFWIALNKASRGDYGGALEYLRAAQDRGRAFPFLSPRVDSYEQEWREKADDPVRERMLWELAVDESVLRVSEHAEEAWEKEYRRIVALAEQGALDQAVSALERLAGDNPGKALFSNDLGVLYTRLGAGDKALSAYQKAVNLEPGNIRFLKNLGDFLYAAKKNVAAAFAIYTRALGADPADVETLAVLAKICIADLNRADDGRIFLLRIIEIDPDNATAREMLAALNAAHASDQSKRPAASPPREAAPPEKAEQDGEKAYLVTALVSAYNSERFIRGCLEDLEAQTIADKLEIIVIDSGSPQHERAIVEEFQKRYGNIRYLRSETRETVYQAWNRGIRASTGKYLTNANTDDRHSRDAFEIMTAVLESKPEISLVYADVFITEKENETFYNHTTTGMFQWHDWDRNHLLKNRCFMGPQPMWRRTVHDRFGFFDEEMVTSGDFEFWLRISQTEQFHHIKKPLGLYLKSPDSIEHRNMNEQAAENVTILREYTAAAKERRLIKFRPFEELLKYVQTGEGSHAELSEPFAQIEETLERRDVMQPAGRNDSAASSLRRIKQEVFSRGLSKKLIERYISVASQALLVRGHDRADDEKILIGTDRKADAGQPVKGMTSIIVVLSGRDSHLKQCVTNIQTHTAEPYELLVIGRKAGGEEVRWFKKQKETYSHYTFLPIGKDADPAALYNEGIRASSGEYILFISDEIVVAPDWLSGLLETVSRGSDRGVVGPMIGGVGKTMTRSLDGRQRVDHSGFTSIPEAVRFAEAFRGRNRTRVVRERYVSGDCMLFRRRLADDIGGFDEGLEGNRFIDDFCLRAELGGYRNTVAGDVIVYHVAGGGNTPRPAGSGKKFDEKWAVEPGTPLGDKILSIKIRDRADEAYGKDRLDDAIKVLLEGRKRLPADERISLHLVEMLIHAGQFQPALDVLTGAPALAGNSAGLTLKGYCLEGLGRDDEAQACADQALSMKEDHIPALNLRGTLSYKRGDKEGAESWFRKAAEKGPGFGETFTNLGVLAWSRGAQEDALDFLEKGFILSPDVDDAVKTYHSAIASTSLFSRAEPLFREARSLHPNNKKIVFFLIDILLRQDKFSDAMDLIEGALVRFGVDDETLQAALAVRDRVGAKSIDKHDNRSALSLCMIVRNEEKYLAPCMNSVKNIVGEIVIVDTGSTDRTKDIAKVFGARVFDFSWQDDFAAARNASLEKAAGDWILVLDGDEVVAERDIAELAAIVEKNRKGVAYNIDTRNYTRNVVANWTANDGRYREEAGSGWFPSTKVRLFPNDDRIRFVNPVHELVEPTLKSAGYRILECRVPVHHYGKLDQGKTARKGEAYFLLGMEKLKQDDRNAKAVFELAIQATELGRYEDAIGLWNRLIELMPGFDSAYINAVKPYAETGRMEEALAMAKKGLALSPAKREAVFHYALCEFYSGNFPASGALLEDFIANDPDYPPILALLAAVSILTEKRSEGLGLINRLRRMGFNYPEYACLEARKLVSLGRTDDAGSLLSALIDSGVTSPGMAALYEECSRVTQQV